MSHHDLDFDQRVTRLSRKHLAMKRGYSTYMRSDGLLVTAPARATPRIPLRMVLFFIAAFFAFKALAIASAGVAAYDDRVTRLKEGTVAEAAGAWVLQSDPLSETLGAQIGGLLR